MIHPKRHKKHANALLGLGTLKVNERQCCSGAKPGEGRRTWRIKRFGWGKWSWGREGREGLMHSSVNEIHHHPFDSFVTFSTGAIGRPPGSYTSKTRMSTSWWLGGTLFSSNEMFFCLVLFCFLGDKMKNLGGERETKHFSMFLHIRSLAHALTHTDNYLGGSTHYWSLKLHQTNKQWKLKTHLFTQWLFFLKILYLVYFSVKFLYIAATLFFFSYVTVLSLMKLWCRNKAKCCRKKTK